MEPLIEVVDIVNNFGDQCVHDGLNFSVYPDQIVAIVGGSGTGKSVLLRSITGLQKPDSGHIHVVGKDITQMSKKEMLETQRLWGVLFQSGALFSSMTVQENIEVALKEFTQLSPTLRKELAEIKIELVGLPAVARDKYPSELSGGMVKRAALARALALDPKILFLDEPTAGLDPISAAEFDQLIKKLVTHLHIAVVMITHDLDTLFSICDQIAVLVDKKVRMDTLENHLKSDHPWIKDYFHGERSRAILGGS